MILQFKFKYLCNNGTLLKFLNSCASKFEVEYKILREKEFLVLYVQAQLEILEIFLTKLSSYLPMSIYFYDSLINEVQKMPFEKTLDIKDDFILPFCTSCLNDVEDDESKDYYNAFKFCNNCGINLNTKKFIFSSKNTKEMHDSNINIFEKVAKLISENKRIKIKTLAGEFIFSMMDIKNNNSKVLCTNIEELSSIFTVKKSEISALLSIEKPIINLKINESCKNSSKFDTFDVRYANDFILYLLSLQLKKLNVNFLQYDLNVDYDYFLDFQSDVFFDLLDIPKISIVKDEKRMILDSKNYNKELNKVYETF